MPIVMHAFALGAPSAFPFREKAAYLTRRILANRDVRRGFGERASNSLRGFDHWVWFPTNGWGTEMSMLYAWVSVANVRLTLH